MKGRLIGVGVGPGDPELMTLKAIRTIKENSCIALPQQKKKEDCMAYSIAVQAVPELENKDILYIDMPMTKDKEKLRQAHEAGAKKVAEVLDKGENVVFLTIGDPCVYSTYMYIHRLAQKMGYDTEIVNGIPSFCAASAKLNQSLCDNKQELHIFPATYTEQDAFDLPGTKVFMKGSFKRMADAAKNRGLSAQMVENCGLKTEKIYRSVDDIKEDPGYYCILVVKEKDE